MLLEFKLASAGVTAVTDMNTKCGEVSSFGAELACHYEWQPPTQLIRVLGLHLGYLTLLMVRNLWKKRIGHQPRSCKSPMTVTDVMFSPSLRLADGKTSGKRLRGLADLGAVAQFGCELQQGTKVWFSPLPEQGLWGVPARGCGGSSSHQLLLEGLDAGGMSP